MKFFIDSADVEKIKEIVELGICDGITTNPTIIKRSGRNQKEVIEELSKIVDGPISVEGVAQKAEEIVKEGEEFAKWGKNIVVKVAMSKEGIKAVRMLKEIGIKTNVTLIFSPSQALIAAKAGADYISPFVGRLDDISADGNGLISDVVEILKNYNYKTEVIVASIRHPIHVVHAALVGAHIATIPPAVVDKLFEHPLTEKGIEKFIEDYKSVK